MCLAVPMEIISIDGDTAVCRLNEISVSASISLVPHAKVGDYAIIHAGFAIEVMDEKEAEETIGLFDELENAYRETEGDKGSRN